MTDEKRLEIKTRASGLIAEGCNIPQVADEIMMSYIFNSPHVYGEHEHYNIDDIMNITQEAYNEAYPPVEAPE